MVDGRVDGSVSGRAEEGRTESRGGFEARLERALARSVEGFRSLVRAERLSGGASQETYRLVVETEAGQRLLALRRAAGGVEAEEIAAQDVSETGYPGLRTEAVLMRAARDAGIPEPRVLGVLESSDGLGDGFLMEWLEGETLGARIVRSEELADVRPRLARECGEIMARIHAIDLDAPADQASEDGAPRTLRDLLQVVTPESYLHQTWDRYKALPTPEPMIDWVGVWLEDHLPSGARSTLVHNDFRNGNVMVSQDGVVAVLDWEIAHIGDPMRDLGWMCTNSWRFGRTDLPVGGFGQREDLFAGYEEASGIEVDPEHVKWWEVFGSFWWAVGTLGMAQHYRTGPDRTVERPAIGRRTSECQVDCVNLLIPGPVELVVALDERGRPTADETVGPDMPSSAELVGSVRDFLRGVVMGETEGRSSFLARVAANSLDVVYRDLLFGERHRELEHRRLEVLLGARGSLEELRWRLTRGLREREIPLDAPGLAEHLRATVVNQIAIDQPKYSGFRTATRS